MVFSCFSNRMPLTKEKLVHPLRAISHLFFTSIENGSLYQDPFDLILLEPLA